jgi:hypothetical protein
MYLECVDEALRLVDVGARGGEDDGQQLRVQEEPDHLQDCE